MNQKENYAKAKEKALEVINSGQYSLMPTFDKVFKTERYTAETIWAQLFSAPDSYSGMHNESSPIGSQTALYLPTDAFIASFDKGDMRKEWGIKPEYVNAKEIKSSRVHIIISISMKSIWNRSCQHLIPIF